MSMIPVSAYTGSSCEKAGTAKYAATISAAAVLFIPNSLLCTAIDAQGGTVIYRCTIFIYQHQAGNRQLPPGSHNGEFLRVDAPGFEFPLGTGERAIDAA